MKKILASTFLVLAVAGGLIGCSSGKQNSKTVSLRVAIVARSVRDESVKSFEAYLKKELPEHQSDGKSFSVVGVSGGDSVADPMSVMAGSTKIAAMLASKEIELWIGDPENSRRYSDNGENFLALDELFSAEEISSFGGTTIAIPVTDRDGNPTVGFSKIVGVDLSQNTAVVEATGIADPQMFILAGSANLETAKATFRFLAK